MRGTEMRCIFYLLSYLACWAVCCTWVDLLVMDDSSSSLRTRLQGLSLLLVGGVF